jgi:hypothetical protein
MKFSDLKARTHTVGRKLWLKLITPVGSNKKEAVLLKRVRDGEKHLKALEQAWPELQALCEEAEKTVYAKNQGQAYRELHELILEGRIRGIPLGKIVPAQVYLKLIMGGFYLLPHQITRLGLIPKEAEILDNLKPKF